MRFHKTFKRRVGAVSSDPVLGSDAAPTSQPQATADNVFSFAMTHPMGWPVHRVVVGYSYAGAGPALTLTADLYLYDEESAVWYQVNATPVQLLPGKLGTFDLVSPSAPKPATSSGGGVDACIVVTAAGGDPNGIYTFALAADLAAAGASVAAASGGGGGGGGGVAAALADADANPTTTRQGANNLVFNGTTWDRLRGWAAGLASKTATFTGFLVNVPFARYVAARPVLATGEAAHAMANTRGDLAIEEQFIPLAEDNTNGVYWEHAAPIAAATNALLWDDTVALAASKSVKATPGRLYAIHGSNRDAAERFIQIFDKASAPSAADVPVMTIPVPAATSFSWSQPFGRVFTLGISWGISTTLNTFTSAGAQAVVNVGYK